MITAYLKDLIDKEGVFRIVYLDEGKEIADQTYRIMPLTDDAIKATARAETTRLTVIQQPPSFTMKVGDLIDLTPPQSAPSVPDPARDEFALLLVQEGLIARKLPRGLATQDQLDAVREQIKAAYKPEFEDML